MNISLPSETRSGRSETVPKSIEIISASPRMTHFKSVKILQHMQIMREFNFIYHS